MGKRGEYAVRLTLGLLLFGAPRGLRAADYETTIDVASQAELDDLHAAGTISDETLETLSELLQTGVDLDIASRDDIYALPGVSYADVDRILQHRAAGRPLGDPFELSRAGILSSTQVMQLLPFVVLRKPPEPERPGRRKQQHPSGRKRVPAARDQPPISGRLQISARTIWRDAVAPPLLVQGRVELPANLSVGLAATTTRLQLGDVRYDASRNALVAEAARHRATLPKAFVHWRTPRVSLLAGSFRLGFAERLTLDNTRRRYPDGIYPDAALRLSQESAGFCRYSSAGGAPPVCNESDASLYVAADADPQPGFRGLAGSIRNIPLGAAARLSLYGFGSYQDRSVYQYEIFNRRTCADPRMTTDECAAPALFEGPEGTRRLAFVSLRQAYDELAGGGHLNLAIGGGMQCGLTGFYAVPVWRVPGAELDFQEWSRYPFGGPFGAFGINAGARIGPFGFFVEGARSVDATPGGGGFAVTQRSRLRSSSQELELSLRYYDQRFANSHARPVSAADELDGQRARNERGARLRYQAGRADSLRFRALSDLWTAAADAARPGKAATLNLELQAGVDFVFRPALQLGIWADHANKDLAHNGRGLCYDRIADELGLDARDGGVRACHGELTRLTLRLALAPSGRALSAAVQYGQALVTEPRYDGGFRHDARLSGELQWRASEQLLLRLRSRYVDQALDDDQYLERTLFGSFDVNTAVAPELAVRARYALAFFLDRRESTLARRPNPEHALQLQLETRF